MDHGWFDFFLGVGAFALVAILLLTRLLFFFAIQIGDFKFGAHPIVIMLLGSLESEIDSSDLIYSMLADDLLLLLDSIVIN